MTTVRTSAEQAQRGVQLSTNRKTTVEVSIASLEILIGGPYADHTYGHTALRVNVGPLERVYDYGRYGKYFGPSGQGVLRVWSNFQAYINDENALRRVTTGFVYEMSMEKAQDVIGSFTSKTTGKDSLLITKHFSSYVIDTYFALGPNCTTVSLDAAKIALPNIDKDWKKYQKGRGLSFVERQAVAAKGWPPYTFLPADCQDMLQHNDISFKSRNTYKL